MNNTIYTKEKNIPFQTFFNNDVKVIKIEDDGPTVADESSTAINEEKSVSAPNWIQVKAHFINFICCFFDL